jgi:L-threonylcarbamoyladenylate synthase
VSSKSKSSSVIAYSLDDAIEALRAGELVVYPTETFYGLGADAFSSAALARLFAVKVRDRANPVGLIAADIAMAFSVADQINPWARRLAEAFWPGPLTIVLPARDGIAQELYGPDGVAIRVSSNAVARALSAGLGRPITATSANRSGELPATSLKMARKSFGSKVKVYLEGGMLTASMPSTVVSVSDETWNVLRPGAISETEIAAVLSIEALK